MVTGSDASRDEMWLRVFRSLNEAQQRWFGAQRALEWGHGGIERVAQLTGMSRSRINRGMAELTGDGDLDTSVRIRQPGGGRKKFEQKDPGVLDALEQILSEGTSGSPMSALRWTTKSTRGLAAELARRDHQVGVSTVRRLLHDLGYSLQSNQKDREDGDHPDRGAQFEKINAAVEEFQSAGQPVISVDTKKKEKVGAFKNDGRTWRPKGDPIKVLVHDFPSLGSGTAVPYGLYDVQKNAGMVNVGTSADTAEFAVESLRQWWKRFGQGQYPDADRLLLCADGGGSNGYRNRAWKYFLQEFADESGLDVRVAHYPPGTSKWNKIEHRMFSFISLAWRGQPLVDYETVVNLIGSTSTATGLQVDARLDLRSYEKGIKITDDQMDTLRLRLDHQLPQWNYILAAN